MVKDPGVILKDTILQIHNIDFSIFTELLIKGRGYTSVEDVPFQFVKTSWDIFVKNPFEWFIIADENTQLAFAEKLLTLKERSKG